MDIQREEFELTFQKTSFCKNMVKSLENSDCPFTSVFEMRNGKYRSSYVQLSFEIWQAAKAQAVPAQLDVNSILHDIDCYFDNGLSNTERTANNLLQSIYEKLSGEVKTQEPVND